MLLLKPKGVPLGEGLSTHVFCRKRRPGALRWDLMLSLTSKDKQSCSRLIMNVSSHKQTPSDILMKSSLWFCNFIQLQTKQGCIALHWGFIHHALVSVTLKIMALVYHHKWFVTTFETIDGLEHWQIGVSTMLSLLWLCYITVLGFDHWSVFRFGLSCVRAVVSA